MHQLHQNITDRSFLMPVPTKRSWLWIPALPEPPWQYEKSVDYTLNAPRVDLMHCILTSDRFPGDPKFSFLPQTFSSLWVLCEDGQAADKSFRAGWWDIVLCWSCERYLYCVKEQWAKNHLVLLYSWVKNKDFRTESLATGSVSPPRQKPNEMQHLDHEWTVSDEQDAWLNSLEKTRNGEVQEVKKDLSCSPTKWN